jgi:hypothetical protein
MDIGIDDQTEEDIQRGALLDALELEADKLLQLQKLEQGLTDQYATSQGIAASRGVPLSCARCERFAGMLFNKLCWRCAGEESPQTFSSVCTRCDGTGEVDLADEPLEVIEAALVNMQASVVAADAAYQAAIERKPKLAKRQASNYRGVAAPPEAPAW